MATPGPHECYLNANRLENLLLVCRTCHKRLEAGMRTRGALDGLGYASLSLAPLYLMRDREDIDAHIARADAPRDDTPGGDAATEYLHDACGLPTQRAHARRIRL